jgi:hypothetical protein
MKPHRMDGISLSFALIFLAIVGWYWLAQVVDLDLPAVGWFVAGGLILLGVLGLTMALRTARTAPPPPPPDEPEPLPEIEPDLEPQDDKQ